MNKKLRILYSLPHPADRLGHQGAGHVVRASAILEALQGLGHEVIRVEAATGTGVKFYVEIYRKYVRKILPSFIAMRMRDAARIRHGKNYAKRLIQTAELHRPDLILETHVAFSLAGKLASEYLGLPLILDDCSPAWEEEQQYGVALKDEARKIYREVTGHASCIVAVNATMRKNLMDENIDPDKIIVIENGFNSTLFKPNTDGSYRRSQLKIPDRKLIILFVGSFQAYHKVDLLIEAFSVMTHRHQAQLLMVGDGKKFQEARQMVSKLHLENEITFTGRVPYQDIPSYVAAGDVTVMPATNDYGNPMKVYEYMALGKVVVAPDQPTIREILTNNSDSVLFEPDNARSLAKALDDLILGEEKRVNMGKRAALRAAEHTWEKRAIVLQDAIYKTLLSG